MTETFLIDRLSLTGDGISTYMTHGPTYAPGALPGETVSGRRVGNRLTDMRIIDPSPDRVSPPCRHARQCGGCQMQHANDHFAAEWKRRIVQSALAGQNILAEVLPTQTSGVRSRRRATLSARRTKKGALVGFHAKRSDSVVEVPDCQLVTDRIRAVQPLLAQMATLGGSRKGTLSALVTDSDGGLDLVVTGGKPLDAELHQSLAQLARDADLARLTWNDEGVALRRPPLQMFDGIAVTPPPGAFLQATTHGETALRQAVMPAIAGARRVADLFAGCGTFALPVARHAQVHAVETDAAMLRALDQGWRNATGLRHVTTETRDLFRNPLLPEELNRFDAVVLDPPRAGAEAQVTALTGSVVPVVAYVSCNPVTFARDAARLMACGYGIGPVTVVDQFRWSSHVELCAIFTKT